MTATGTGRTAQRSLRSRVVASVLSLLLVCGVFVAIASFVYGRQAARTAYDTLLLGAANDIAESIKVIDSAPVADLPVSAFQLLAVASEDRIAYALRGPDGTLLTGQDSARPNPQIQGRALTAPAFFDADLQGDAARFVTLTRQFAERDYSGRVSVTVGQTIRARNAMALSLTRDVLIVLGLAGTALMMLAFLVIRSAMRPLEQIADDLLQRDPYDLTPMATQVPAEVAVMLHAVNRFMLRLDRQIDVMRNLISDTAHQLRTPVAAIRAQAELATEEDDTEKQAQGLERLVRRTRSLGDLLDQMLSRALVIHRTDSAPRSLVDLREVALNVVEARDHEVLAPMMEVELVIPDHPVTVMADEITLIEALKNMQSNALRYGASPVHIGVSVENGQAALWVQDAGHGPAPEVLDHIGGRFERSAASKGQSAGLGLSIVSAVAAAFDGDLDMARNAAGFRVTLRLPLQGKVAG